MKRVRLFQTIIIALVFVGAVYLFLRSELSDELEGAEESALPADLPTEEIGSETALDIYFPATADKEGLVFEVVGFRWVGEEAQFDVKFPLIDERDWQIRNVVYLVIDGVQIPVSRMELVELARPAVDGEQLHRWIENGAVREEVIADTGQAYRVDRLIFTGVPSNLDERDFSLIIEEINTIPNEGGFCDPDIIQSIQVPMAENYPGIEIVCQSEPGFDGFVIAPVSALAEDPEVLSFFDVVVNHALSGRIIGFWTFEFGR